jgi:hypothetical protein
VRVSLICIDTTGTEARRAAVKGCAEAAHLVFELGVVRAQVMHPTLVVQCRHRLSTSDFAARSRDARERHIWGDHPQRRLNHAAAVIDFRDNPVGPQVVVQRNGAAGPVRRCHLTAGVDQDISVIVLSLADRNDADLIALGAAAGVNGDDDAAEYRRGVAPQFLDPIAVPERARCVVQQLGHQLLPAQPGALVPARNFAEELRGQVGTVVVGRRSRDDDVPSRASRALKVLVGFGVVAMAHCGRLPSRSPNIS